MADLLDVAAVLSSLGAALVGVAVASRTLYALARDRILGGGISSVSQDTGTPIGAVAVSMTLTLVALVAFGVAGTSALNAFFYLATIGTLSVLVVYVLVSISAARRQAWGPDRRSPAALILPLGGALVAGYVLYRNLFPAPAFPFNLFPYIVLGWLMLGLTLAIAVPEIRHRVSQGLAVR
jgi:amino acid transporter